MHSFRRSAQRLSLPVFPMKMLACAACAMALLLVSCSNDARYESRLAEIDSLTFVNADSARQCLEQLAPEMDNAGDAVRAYYHLLCVKAADKANVVHTSDSLIQLARDYYEATFDHHRLPETYYYCGRVNTDLRQGKRAMFYYQLALLQDSTYVTDYLMSRIFAQIAYIYERNELYDYALSMQQMAGLYCQQAGDTAGVRTTALLIKADSALARMPRNEFDAHARLVALQVINEQVKGHLLRMQNHELEQQTTQQRHRTALIITLASVLVIAVIVLILWRVRQIRRNVALDESTYQQTLEAMRSDTSRRRFYDNDVNDLLTQRAAANKMLRPADWELIESRLLSAFPDFKDTLYSLHTFSETEYRICMLIKLEVSPSVMAKLLAMTNSAISQRRLRMQKKAFNNDGTAKDWDTYILSL